MTIEQMFNNDSRYVMGKVDVYNSTGVLICTLTKDDYLVSFSSLAESGSTSNVPFGGVSSNVLNVVLYNSDNTFKTPYNNAGISLLTGFKLIASVAVDIVTESSGWKKIGEFYIQDISASLGTLTITLTAYDILYPLLTKSMPKLTAVKNEVASAFMRRILVAEGIPTDKIYGVGTFSTIPFTYADNVQNNMLFNDFVLAQNAAMYVDANGYVCIKQIVQKPIADYIIDDVSQIIELTANSSIGGRSLGVRVNYFLTDISENNEPIFSTSYAFLVGTHTSELFTLNTLAYRITSIFCDSAVNIKSFTFTSTSFIFTYECVTAVTAELTVYGNVIKKTASSITAGVTTDTMLECTSICIQSAVQATTVANFLLDYIDAPIPSISLNIRGNPLYTLLDTINVKSSINNLDKIGVIKKITLEYSGALQSSIVLLCKD